MYYNSVTYLQLPVQSLKSIARVKKWLIQFDLSAYGGYQQSNSSITGFDSTQAANSTAPARYHAPPTPCDPTYLPRPLRQARSDTMQ